MLCNIDFLFLVAIMLLLSAGIERNPGPEFTFSKVVLASTHQGDPKYGETAGMQCACNAVVSVCWSFFKRCTLWNTIDLDNILDHGDKLFRVINLGRSLYADELPKVIVIEGLQFKVDNVASVNVEMLPRDKFLEQSFWEFKFKSNGLLFFISGYSFSLTWCNKTFCLFDSHSHNKLGYLSGIGKSIYLKFSSLRQVEKYLVDKYLNLRDTLLFQIEYIYVDIDSEEIAKLEKISIMGKSRKRKQSDSYKLSVTEKRAKYSNARGTPEHDKNLHNRRKRYANIVGTPDHNEMLKCRREQYEKIVGTHELQNNI